MTVSNRTGERVGRYELGEPLGRGGMAEVYRATDASLGRAVAVKLILPHYAGEADFRERFLREARLVAALDHPHILPVYDFGEQEGVAYLVMPLLEGGSLAERMGGQAFPLPQVVAWAEQLAGALDAAHAEGILHRDVKPSNVLLGRDGRLALADFGIAKSAEASTRLTTTGSVVGTPAYMAPELAQGQPASPASDLYALGVLVYELLAGEPPFRGDSALAVLHRHVTEPVPPIRRKVPALPAALDAVLARVLAKEPAGRPANCTAFAAELAVAAGLQPVPTVAAPAGPTVLTPASGRALAGGVAGVARRRGRVGIAWVSGALLLLAGSVGGYLLLREVPASPAVQGAGSRGPGFEVPPGGARVAPESAAQATRGEPATGTVGVPATPAGTGSDARVAASQVAAGAESSTLEAPAAVPPVARGLAGVKRAAERGVGMLRPTRRLGERDFREVLDALAGAPPHDDSGVAEPVAPAALEAFARGGLAWLAGDASAARRELEVAASRLGASPTPMANPALVLRPGPLDGGAAWQLAFVFGDPRGDGERLVAAARSAGTASAAQGEFAAAVVERWEGRHAEAARRSLAALETLGATISATERAQLAQLAAEELAMAGDVEGAARAFDRALADGGGQRGALALEAALVLGTRLGRRDLATRFLAVACAAGIERACAEAPAAGERRVPPFGRRRPRPGAPGG